MFRSLFNRLFCDRNSPGHRASARRLGLETLEARDVPALFVVNSLADTISANSALTLREAVSLHNGSLSINNLSAAEKAQVTGSVGTNDRIQFSVTGTLPFASNLPTLMGSLIIEGPGSGALTINGGQFFRHFAVAANANVQLSGLKLVNGHTDQSGGSILNSGTLRVYRVEMSGNTAVSHGGAIENNGTLFVDECFIHDNNAAKVGGAIDNNATATITSTTLQKNTAGNNGGAIWSDGPLTLINDTLTGNKAVNAGGAVRVTDGVVTVTSCTIVSNEADTDGTTFEFGGGISNDGATLTLANTVVASNFRNKGLVRSDISGQANGQFNFIGVNTNMTGIVNGVSGNQVGTPALSLNPILMVLANNGGFAPTFTPAPGSPLLAAGAPTSVAGLTDQRNAGRRTAAATIGAIEVNNPLSAVGVPHQLYGPGPIATSDEAFVKGLYRACLLRDADAGGLAGWVSFLNGHPERRSQVVHGFYNSTENRTNQVTFFYRYFLGREPDAGGLAGWVSVLQAGIDEATVMRGFLLSQEYTGQNNNEQFVKTMYYALLGRNADAAGFAGWKNGLDTAAITRAQAVDAFARALETVQRVVIGYYQTYLGVEPSAFTLNINTAAIQSGFTFGSVAETVLGSAQFYANAAAKVGP